MEILKSKSMILKIAIILVIVILFNFSAPTISQAGVAEVIGGTLLSPIVDLLLAIGDGIMNLIQGILFGMESSLTKVSTEIGDTLPAVVAWIVGIAIVVGTAIITGGLSLVALVAAGIGAYAAYKITADMLPPTVYLPIYVISPEEIFANKIALLDVNFFNPNEYEQITAINGDTSTEQVSTASQLQSTISSWYLTLRNFALVVLLSVLLYIGIRIVTSSAAQDKAKYKEKLFSWIVAMCILFFMHYIMAFATTVVEAISEGINELNTPTIITLPNLKEEDYRVEVISEESGEKEASVVDASEFFVENGLIENEDSSEYYWPTNLMGQVRIQLQLDEGATEDNELLRQLGYTVLFLILVIYTIAFLVVYLKRLIMLAFLTMIAPLVAMTYPLDKMGDGNAQAFNMWLKEYVFNLLIQPLHLILYTMLVGSAISIAARDGGDGTVNMIYAIVAIGFIFQAEKIMRRFFGFDKASTLDANGSAIGGALAMAGISQIKKIAGIGSKKGNAGGKAGSGGAGSGAAASARKIKTRDLMNQITGRNQNGQDADSQGANGQRQLSAQNSLADQRQRNASGRSDEGDRIAAEQQALRDRINSTYPEDMNAEEQREWREREIAEGMARIRETDTRGVGTYLRDSYQGSRLQAGMNKVSDKSRAVAHRFANWAPNTVPVRVARDLGAAGAKSVRAMANTVQSGANKIRTSIPKPIRNSARTLGGHMVQGAKAAGNIAKGVGAVGMQGLKYAAPRVGKAAVKGTLAATAATLGVAGGLASGDDNNILRYGAAGAAAGWAAGSGALGAVGSADDFVKEAASSAASTYTIATKGEEAEKQRQRDLEDKAAMKDKDRQKLYADKLEIPKGDIKKVMKEAQEYRANGITDDEMIIKAMKAEGFGNDRASKERVLLAGLASEVGNDNKKIKDLESRLGEKGLSPQDVKKYVDGVREITGAI